MKKLLLLIALYGCIAGLYAQDAQKDEPAPKDGGLKTLRWADGKRVDFGFGYNFFVGDQAEMMRTTVNGFGSGFIFDLFSGRGSSNVVEFGGKNVHLTLGLGIAITKYRFAKNIVFGRVLPTGDIDVYEDPSTDRKYDNSFFGYGKSKLVVGYLYIPLTLDVRVKEFTFSAGGYTDIYLSGKHKLKFTVDGDKQKEVVRNKDFKDYNLNKLKFGVTAMIKHSSGIGVAGFYTLTPFFTEGNGPKVNEARVSVLFPLSKLIK